MMGRQGTGDSEIWMAGGAVSTKAVERVEGIGSEVEGRNGSASRRLGEDRSLCVAPGPDGMWRWTARVPVLPSEVEGRRGKEGGQAKTREAKLGCVFSKRAAMSYPESTTYVGAIEEATAFGVRIYTEAAGGERRERSGWSSWETAPPGWGIAAEHFHQPSRLDLYHARAPVRQNRLDSAETRVGPALSGVADRGDIVLTRCDNWS